MKKSIYKSYDELPLILNMRNGIPSETQRSGFAGERRRRMSERCCWGQCERYVACDDALGISVNTVAKYVGRLEEHGLITTEHTDVITRDGLKRNGCLRYTILPIQNAVDRFHERQLSALEQTAAQQRAQQRAEKSGVEFVPPDKAQSAWPRHCAACGELCVTMAMRVGYTPHPSCRARCAGCVLQAVVPPEAKCAGAAVGRF